MKSIPRAPVWISVISAIFAVAAWKSIPIIWDFPEEQVRQFQNSLPSSQKLTPREESELVYQYRDALFKHLVSAIGTTATIAGGIVIYLNFRVARKNAEIANKNAQLTEDRLVSERFSKAAEQLGEDSLIVRIGSIYSLEQIAYDSPYDYWTVLEILTAFIRNESPKEPSKMISSSFPHRVISTDKIQEIRSDIQAALTVIGRCNPKNKEGISLLEQRKNQERRLDLSNSNLSGAYLGGLNFSNINFYNSYICNAYLVNSNFQKSNLTKVDFTGSKILGIVLSRANLTATMFHQTQPQFAIGLESAELDNAIWPEGYTPPDNNKKDLP